MELRRAPDGSGSLLVFDPLRRKWLILTPEEWVRQNFVHYLISAKGYPRELIANEISLHLNGTLRRCDSVVFSRTLRPVAILEYKAPTVAITQKVFDQIARYNIVLEAPCLIVSNGMRHFCCRFDKEKGTYAFLREVPSYEELKSFLD
ncbi:MAG: type I restriction enzyme HsdR N-terminal domain-containing protein [Muribaculaceae bacterium]|nr:type I restriction enzyme HsdR N-terminal domain-containing protein [Muribaculaceae bacterium]